MSKVSSARRSIRAIKIAVAEMHALSIAFSALAVRCRWYEARRLDTPRYRECLAALSDLKRMIRDRVQPPENEKGSR